MALNNSQYDTIIRTYEQKQLHNRNLLDKRYETVYNRLPELKEINNQISLLSVSQARKLLNGDDSALATLKEQIQELSEKKTALLVSAGFPIDYLEPIYECADCKDTGYIGNKKCHCFQKAVIDLLYTQSNLQNILQRENFDTFSLAYYSDNHIDPKTGRSSLANMKNAYLTCREFTDTFATDFRNLFLYGDTGVGKTFLSNCIAKELIDNAYSVIYFTAFELFDTIAKSKFEKDNTAEVMYEHIFDCDLLIIDDLGTELANSFTVSQFFLCLNERLLRRKSTIISTNLSLESLVEIYSERTFSRITSNYTMLKLTGDDIRIKKETNEQGGKLMLHRTERTLENIPVGPLGIIPVDGCQKLGNKVNDYLVKWRKEDTCASADDVVFQDYQKDTYIIDAKVPRFGSGEAKGIINESVRGKDIYLMVDVCNYSLTYSLSGHTNHMSPDDHFQNLKRVIAAIGGKGRRINVIMPFLYESRQHKRSSRESLDCALALQELVRMGVDNIITFDAHDPRVQNAIPLNGFETVRPTYQFVKGLLRNVPDLKIDSDHMMAISPDEGATGRAIYLANVLGLDMGMFYKRRDYTRIVDGRNPIVAHEFLGSSVEGKDVIIIDDMISSGDSILDVAKQLKERKANRIFAAATFGLFTNGMEKFDKAYEEGIIHGILTTNLIYQTPELLSRPYYINCDMSKYIALMIDTLNHDGSISSILNPNERIQHVLKKYQNGETI